MPTNESPIRKVEESRPLARRPHTCSVCGHPIAIGTRHVRCVFVDTSLRGPQRLTTVRYHDGKCPAEVLDV